MQAASLLTIRVLLYQCQFIDQVGGPCKFIDDEEDVANIHIDGTLHIGFKHDVAAHGFPVAIEGKADQLTIAIDYRAS